MAQLLPQSGLVEQSPDPLKLTPREEEMEGQWTTAEAGETNQRLDHLDGNVEPGHEKKSILNKVKDKAKKLKSKVKKSMKSNHGGSHEKSHEESSEEEEGEDEEEEQSQTGRKSDGNVDDVAKTLAGLDTFGTRDMLKHINKSSVEPMRAQKSPHTNDMPTEETVMAKEDMETDVGIPIMREKAAKAMAEATESSLGLGKGHQKQDQGREEIPISSKGEGSIFDSKDDVKEAFAPVEDHFHATPEKAELGNSFSQWASERADHGEEKFDGFGVHNGPNAPENRGDLMGNAQDKVTGDQKDYQGGEEKPISSKHGGSIFEAKNLKEAVAPVEDYFNLTPEKAELGKSWNQSASGGVDHGKQKLEGFGVHCGPIATEKRGEEESQSSVGKAQDNVKEAVASVEDHFHATPEKEEMGKSWKERASEGMGHAKEEFGVHNGGPKSGEKPEAEESQSLVGKAQDKVSEIGEGKELASDGKPPKFTDEVISGASEIGTGVMKKASELAEGLKNVLTFDQSSSNNNVKDIMIEGECKGVEDKGTQQPLKGGDERAGQTYAQKLYAAKDAVASKLGYGGKTSQDYNVIGESKPADQMQGTATEAMEGAKESKESFKSALVSKFSPGEDEKALSEAITEAVSNSARSVKESIVGGFYGGNGKTSTTTDVTTDTSQSKSQNTSNTSSGGKGIVDRVTGVVGSFLGRKQGEDSEAHLPSSQKPEPKSVVHVEEQIPEIPTGKSE